MKKNYFLLLTYMLLFAYSCVEDKGNYDYTAINELTISGIATNYTVESFSDLAINPLIDGTQGFSVDDYSYLWCLYKSNHAYNGVDTLSTDRALNVAINAPLGDYVLTYFVKERSTERFISVQTDLKVINSNSIGLAALSRVGDEASVTFINTLNKVTEDIYFKINGERAGKNPVALEYTAPGSYQDAFPAIFLFTDDERGGVVIEPESFSQVMEFSGMFHFAPDQLRPQTVGRRNLYEFLINNGKASVRTVSDAAYPKFGVEATGNYDCAPYLFMGDDCFVFDKKGKQFLNLSVDGVLNRVNSSSHLFDPANMNSQLIWGKGVAAPDPEDDYADLCKIRAVMENGDGSRFLASANAKVVVDIDYENWIFNYEYLVTPTSKIAFPPTAASAFALSEKDADFLYYADGNRIVCMSFLTGNTLATHTLNGGNIDYMEFDKGDRLDILYVGVSNASAQPNSGSIIRLKMASDGSLTEIDRFEGVCGQVVDFTYVE